MTPLLVLAESVFTEESAAKFCFGGYRLETDHKRAQVR
jgi:hypothetical protein